MIIGLSLIFIFRWQINLLTLDEEEAKSLGINVRKYRLIFIVASTLLSAAAVCLGGLIGWVGLMIPHLARALVGVDYRRLIPASTVSYTHLDVYKRQLVTCTTAEITLLVKPVPHFFTGRARIIIEKNFC